MKKQLLVLLGLTLVLGACGPCPVKKAAGETPEQPKAAGQEAAWSEVEPATEGIWTLSWPLAQKSAKEKDLPMLILFTGSDWCHWCKRLEGEILSKEAFQTEAIKNFVPVKMDFPSQPKYSEAVKELQAKLRDSYAVQGYPTIVLALPDGRAFATAGYMKASEAEYLEMLAGKVAAYKELCEKLLALESKVKAGEEEAVKEFWGLLEAYAGEYGDSACIKETLKPSYVLVTGGDSPLAKEYAKKEAAYWRLAELKKKYGSRRVTAEEAKEAEAGYRKAISEFGLEGEAKQKALLELSILFLIAQDGDQAEALQREAVLAAPDTREGQMLYKDLGMDKEGEKAEK